MNWGVIFWTCMTVIVLAGVFGLAISFVSASNMKKRREEMRELYNGLAIGSQVMFAGGLHGRVVGIEEEKETVNVEIARGTVVTCDRFAIQAILNGKKDEK